MKKRKKKEKIQYDKKQNDKQCKVGPTLLMCSLI